MARGSNRRIVTVAGLMLVGLVSFGATVSARGVRCGQPTGGDDIAGLTDCLFVLGAAVGSQTCKLCHCDLDGSGAITAADALRCLHRVIGLDVPVECPPCCPQPPCPGPKSTCTEHMLVTRGGSEMDMGWKGSGRRLPLAEGASFVIDVVRRCSNDYDTVCMLDSDCLTGECVPWCDCDDPSNSECEVTGPVGQRRCVADFEPCTSNADCTSSQECRHFLGPPLPLAAEGTPACLTTYVEEPLAGSIDVVTGETELRGRLRMRVHLGIAIDRPCPRCGAPSENPAIGDQFTCNGGRPDVNGRPCTVDAVSPDFGGVSFDCPLITNSNVSGRGVAIPLRQLTTGTIAKVATVPCFGPLGSAHPSTGNGACFDTFEACATNADCLRCTGDLSPCSTNADCGNGSCAKAPDQPIPCGVYCHCGFCDNDPDQPCFGPDECAKGEVCLPGSAVTGGQGQPNRCANLICGLTGEEACCTAGEPACDQPTDLVGECSLLPYRGCATNADCTLFDAGDCVLSKRPCFEPRIVRTGRPSALGMHCIDDPALRQCTSDADCAIGECVGDSAEPTLVSLFCFPRTTSESINAASGIPGPTALHLEATIFACRCGDGTIGCNEECDDGNNTGGDGCDQTCRVE